MSKSIVRVMCWKHSHSTELSMNLRQEQKLSADIPKMKKVCPDCKPANEMITIVRGATIFSPFKAYRCKHGHLTLIGLLDSMVHIVFGPNDFVNVAGTLSDLPKLIDDHDIACNHVIDESPCDCSLVPVDDFELSYPSSASIKTKTRIGDLWDRHGIEPVRTGTYNDNGYSESKTQKANTARLNALRAKTRNIPVDKHPGKPIKKATKNHYGYRDRSSLDL